MPTSDRIIQKILQTAQEEDDAFMAQDGEALGRARAEGERLLEELAVTLNGNRAEAEARVMEARACKPVQPRTF